MAGGLNLQAGYMLYATTQNAEIFNVIANRLDQGAYQTNLPPGCRSFKQVAPTVHVNIMMHLDYIAIATNGPYYVAK